MDIYCSRCGEPWEQETLHEEVSHRYPNEPWFVEEKPEGIWSHTNDSGLWHNQTIYEKYFNEIRREFTSKGCKTFTVYNDGVSSWCDEHANKKNSIYGSLMELAGDDIDFAASMMEDAERLGLVD